MSESGDILVLRKGFMESSVRSIAILKDKDNKFILGAPMMTGTVILKI